MQLVREAKVVFWDFDGVVKRSVEVKAEAFGRLFAAHGAALRERVQAHHRANGGMSRFEKMPVYLQWAGLPVSVSQVREYCDRFSELAQQGVIESEWVAGAERLLRENPYGQRFVLISATPQDEMEAILDALSLRGCFDRVYGSPASKSAAIRETLARHSMQPADGLVIGDARADYDAARSNGVPFLLVRHESNAAVFADYRGQSTEDFTAS
jgi:phosphoglycolate phosphatase-like HAD superfamily hydrolase